MNRNPRTPRKPQGPDSSYALDGGTSTDSHPIPFRAKIMAGMAIAGLLGGLYAANTRGATPGESVENETVEAITEGQEVARAGFGIHLRNGVKIRLTPEVTRDANGTSATDANVARVTEQNELIVGAIIAKDKNGVEWYGVPLGEIPEGTDDLSEHLGWVSSEVFTQENVDGERFAERIYIDNSSALTSTSSQTLLLNEGEDPEAALIAHLAQQNEASQKSVATDSDGPGQPGA